MQFFSHSKISKTKKLILRKKIQTQLEKMLFKAVILISVLSSKINFTKSCCCCK